MIENTAKTPTTNILQRMKIIANLRNNDVMFLESDGVKYEEYLVLLIFKDISKKIPLITRRILDLICDYLAIYNT